jgi:hypothetical protein
MQWNDSVLFGVSRLSLTVEMSLRNRTFHLHELYLDTHGRCRASFGMKKPLSRSWSEFQERHSIEASQ